MLEFPADASGLTELVSFTEFQHRRHPLVARICVN
jgi:hypothetical protein